MTGPIERLGEALEVVEAWFAKRFVVRAEVKLDEGVLALMKWNGERGLYILLDTAKDPIVLSSASIALRVKAAMVLPDLELAALTEEEEFRVRLERAGAAVQLFLDQRKEATP